MVALAAALSVAGVAADPDIGPPFDVLQPPLLREAFAKLDKPQKGTGLYAIGVAGWWEQDVFRKELDGALAAIGRILPLKDRTVSLINNRDTIASAPLASPRNIAAAVHEVAGRMNKDEDVLVLMVTTHGAMDGVTLQMPRGNQVVLTPKDFAWLLDREGVRNRVIIVSACYSGAFVRPLADDNTIVITAADAKSASFGCAAGRDWTYFGDAFFRQSLALERDFKGAFERARTLIAGWERMDRLPPSNPQAHFGEALNAKLAPIIKAMPQAEP